MAAEGQVVLGFGKASRLLKQSEFNRVFKQVTGTTPRAWRADLAGAA